MGSALSDSKCACCSDSSVNADMVNPQSPLQRSPHEAEVVGPAIIAQTSFEQTLKGRLDRHASKKLTGLFAVEVTLVEGMDEQKFSLWSNDLGCSFEKGDPIVVSSIDVDSPAEELGIRVGMMVRAIGGRAIKGNPPDEALAMLNTALDELPSFASMAPVPSHLTKTKSHMSKSSTQQKLLTDGSYFLTGIFAKWLTNFEEGRLEPVPAITKGTALLKACVKLVSQSFSFQVVSHERGWTWRLYPRDAKPIRVGFITSHVSKEGFMKPGVPEHVAVGVGDGRKGDGLNFHVVEAKDKVVTIWIQVPASPSADRTQLELRTDTEDGFQVWYTLEDTGVQCIGGDNVNLNLYKKYLPPDMLLD